MLDLKKNSDFNHKAARVVLNLAWTVVKANLQYSWVFYNSDR